MLDFSPGDWFFIGLILLVIHGIMFVLACVRRRKSSGKS